MKKWFGIALVLVLLIICILPTKAEAATSGYYTYTVSNGEATITNCDTSISGDITIPSTLGGYPVTSIGNYAFYGCSSLTSITIPDSVTSIGSGAFYNCSSLTSITIPNSVTSIGSGAFYDCSSLTSITIPDSVTSIGGAAFYGCSSLTSITIPDSVTSIGDYAFYYCSSLTSITIPDSVTSIGGYAFYKCSSLTSITIPDNVTSIGNSAFSDCSSLTSITVRADNAHYASEGGVLFNKGKTFLVCYPSGKAEGSYKIPDSVTSIGDWAFYDCSSLTSITIPDNVTSIGNSAFSDCSSLTSITIPDSVTSIGNSAFRDCSSLTSITIPDSVTRIGSGAFHDCSSLTSITIPDSVTSIGNSAFEGCSSLTNITIPDSVTSIGDYAFRDCSSLTSVTIGNSVTSIGDYAFAWCSSLTSITIPDSVTSIGDWAFDDCRSMTSVYITDIAAWCKITFAPYYSNPLYYGANLYLNDKLVTDLVIPDSVTSIGWYAFQGCSSLTSITIPDSVTSIDYAAFARCSSLTSITIPDSVTSIGGAAFYGCSSLTSITIPDSVTSIGDYAFYYCSSLTSITIPDSVTSISYSAFEGCSSLTSIVIPESITRIRSYAFYNCGSLSHVAYKGTESQWGAVTVESYNTALTEVPDFHYETAFVTVNNCVESGVYCPVCQEYIIREERNAHVYEDGVCTRCGESEYFRMSLTEDTTVTLELERDVYIQLNGFDLTGTITTNGFKVYGMDETTAGYTCENIGYFTCVDEKGDPVVPERYYQVDSENWYLTVGSEEGYSFHAVRLAVTHMTLRPDVVGVGYKAVLCGDEMVLSQLDAAKAFRFCLQLDGYDPVYRHLERGELVSGNEISFRLINYDIENYGETDLFASLAITLQDGTVLGTPKATMTMRSLFEYVNDNTSQYTQTQLADIKTMIETYAIIKKWDVSNLI